MSLNSLPWWLYALLSALFAALTTIFAKVGVSQVSSNLATAIRTIVILLIAWGIVFATGEQAQMGILSRRTLLFLVLSGIATGLSWLAYFKALQLGKASAVAPIDKSSLVLIVILSALFLHEPLTWKTTLGAALIVAGTLVFIL
jgi:transporter family protein